MGARRITPAGLGAVAVIEVVGDASEDALATSFTRALPARHGIAYGEFVDTDTNERIDEVLVMRRDDGALELHVHGSPTIVRRALELLGSDDDEEAPTSIEERAWRAVSSSASELGARVLIDQSEGALRRELEALRDAPDAARLAELSERGRVARRLFTRTTVAIVGDVNAGKSTLFNALVGETAAVVTDEAGTTRDALGAVARFGPWPVLLVDTAGARELPSGDAAAEVEAAGQRLGREAAARADWVLRLVPADRAGTPSDEGVVRSRAAEHHGGDPGTWPAGSLAALEHPEHARRVVEARFREALSLPDETPWFPGRAVPFDDETTGTILDAGRNLANAPALLDSLLARR